MADVFKDGGAAKAPRSGTVYAIDVDKLHARFLRL
jgi:hypothetical protein